MVEEFRNSHAKGDFNSNLKLEIKQMDDAISKHLLAEPKYRDQTVPFQANTSIGTELMLGLHDFFFRDDRGIAEPLRFSLLLLLLLPPLVNCAVVSTQRY